MDMSDEDGQPRDASGLRSAPPSPPATERDLEPVRIPDDTGEAETRNWYHDAESTTRPRPPSRAPSESERPAQGVRLPELPPHLQVRKVLGQGGTAVVYEALHTRLNVRVAVKVLAAADPHEAEARSRLLREAELYARLSDPRFPRVYDVDELPDGTPFVVMEFIEGRTLAEALMFGPMEVDAVYYVAREILEALTEIHQVGIVHRDIKPSNILLEGDWGDDVGVRLVDFGIAKSVLSEPTAHPLTQQGTMLGTPHYMAPEQITAQPLDERVDIYAVGVVLYELLTGQMPFDGPTVGEVIAAALRDTPKPLSSLRADVPKGLESVIMRAMARERDDRFASAHEMLCALHAARVEDQGLLPLPTVEEGEQANAQVEEPRVLTIVPEDDERETARAEDADEAEPLLLSKPTHDVALTQAEPESEGDDTIVESDPETLAMLGNLRAAKKKTRDFSWYAARIAALLAMIALMAWPAELFDLGAWAPTSEQAPTQNTPSATPSNAPASTSAEALPVPPGTQLSPPSLSPAAVPAQVMPLPEPAEITDDQLSPDGETQPVSGKSSTDEVAAEKRPKREKRRAEKPAARPAPAAAQPAAPAAPPPAPAKDIAPVEPRPLDLTPNLETRRPPAPRRQLDQLPANPY